MLENFGFKKITEGYGSFIKGMENKNLIIDKLNILPLICYEVIFTDFIQKARDDTNLIINISEDGWFGKSDRTRLNTLLNQFSGQLKNDTFFEICQ